jgi:DNA helicase HerA-like ATPase
MVMMDTLFIGAGPAGADRQALDLRRANRHGLIAGATGTGKTVTLQRMAEQFSAAGVPVLVADVKGDLAGLAMPSSPLDRASTALGARAAEIGLPPITPAAAPVIFWDLLGELGHPIRATVSEMGPLLLANLLALNETQAGVLEIAFRAADDDGLLLIDLGDLRAMLAWCAENAAGLSARYGNVTRASVGAIQRALLRLEGQGGDRFFGEPAFDLRDLLHVDDRGRGYVSVLAAEGLMTAPKLYASFLLWLLSELFETLPEVGDPEKPVLVFFFDEAHLLFDDAPAALIDKVAQTVRLIRSKGVGIYFVTQNPIDVPDEVAGQLGHRVQHALRAYTPRETKAVKAAAETFRPNPPLDVYAAIGELKVGEALVSLLQADGSPAPVARALIAPPASRVGPISAGERAAVRAGSPVGTRYDLTVDRASAEELLAARAAEAQPAEPAATARTAARRPARTMTEKMIHSAAQSAASAVGRQIGGRLGGQILRGLMGGWLRG